MAALEVVRRNLQGVGLDAFCLSLHSELGKPREVYEDLKARLGLRPRRPERLSSAQERFDLLRRELLDYRDALLHTCGPRNEPIHEILWRVVKLRSYGVKSRRELRVDPTLDEAALEERRHLLKQIRKQLHEIGPVRDCPWRGYRCSGFYSANEEQVKESLDELIAAAARFESAARTFKRENLCDAFWSLRTLAGVVPIDETVLSIPAKGISESICKGLLGSHALETAKQLARDLERCRQASQALSAKWAAPQKEWALAAQTIQNAMLAIAKPAMELDLATAFGLISRLEIVQSRVEQLKSTLPAFSRFGYNPITLSHLEGACSVLRLLLKLDNQKRAAIHDRLFLENANELINNARIASNSLRRSAHELENVFVLRDAPQSHQIQSQRQTIQRWHRSKFRWFRDEYRKAKREVLQYLHASQRWKPRRLLNDLEALESISRSIEEFRLDVRFRALLPGLFRGVDTEWGEVDKLIEWIAVVKAKGMTCSVVLDKLQRLDAEESCQWIDETARLVESLKQELVNEPLLTVLGVSFDQFWQRSLPELSERLSSAKRSLESLANCSECVRLEDSEGLSGLYAVAIETLRLGNLEQNICQNLKYAELCGREFDGARTDLALLNRTVAWFEGVQDLALPDAMLAWLCGGSVVERAARSQAALRSVEREVESWNTWLDQLKRYGIIDSEWLFCIDGFDELSSRLEFLSNRMATLGIWAAYCRSVEMAEQLELTSFVEAVECGELAPDEAVDVFDLHFWQGIANIAINAKPALAKFSRQRHESIRAEFSEIDKKLMELTRKGIAARCAERKAPEGVSTGRVRDYTELGLIRNETNKSKRHCRIRSLVSRARGALQCLKPCFMMSPLAVAQYLPPGAVQFDLIVMDEASQIKPEDALGAIIRGRQLVVVGDPKQLPPTSFFEKLDQVEVENDEELIVDDAESILEVAMKAFPRVRRLKWHYRSQHHRLIQFSNEQFYDGDLLIFPSVSARSGALGIRFHSVDGEFESGRNLKEAEAVAAAIASHAKSCTKESLGVGTFNIKQRDLILDLVDQLCVNDAELRTRIEELSGGMDGLFIKNLENLQGDERDVIIISYTYGRDPRSQRVFQRFHPITLENGWRRLNVLITRARKRVEVFSSIAPTDIQAAGKSRGVVAMRDYLEFARTECIPERVKWTEREFESPFEEAVASAIADFGLEVIPQVGVAGYRIDLGILRPGSEEDFLLGVECDGAMYHSAKSVRDRDRLREEIIVSRGWNIYRIWSTDWFRNQPTEVERLRKHIERLLETDSSSC